MPSRTTTRDRSSNAIYVCYQAKQGHPASGTTSTACPRPRLAIHQSNHRINHNSDVRKNPKMSVAQAANARMPRSRWCSSTLRAAAQPFPPTRKSAAQRPLRSRNNIKTAAAPAHAAANISPKKRGSTQTTIGAPPAAHSPEINLTRNVGDFLAARSLPASPGFCGAAVAFMRINLPLLECPGVGGVVQPLGRRHLPSPTR